MLKEQLRYKKNKRMRYESWLTYPEMSVAVQKIDGSYRCMEYDLNGKSRRNSKLCESVVELKFYLLSLPMPPKKEILELIKRLTPKTKTESKIANI